MTRSKYNPRNLKYKVNVTIEGYPAEILDELVDSGLYGDNRAQVLRNLAFSKIERILKEGLLESLRKIEHSRERGKK